MKYSGNMPFNPGDHVHVAALGRGTVREVRNGGRYVVELKGRAVLVREGELTAMAPHQTKAREELHRGTEPAIPEALARRVAAESLDLHGMTTADALPAVDAFLSDALLASLSRVRIIHGRSGGQLKRAVHSRLRNLPSVRAFRLDPRNPGVTIVDL